MLRSVSFRRIAMIGTIAAASGLGVPVLAADGTPLFMEHLELAERGSSASQNIVGVMYYLGDGTNHDPAEARRWFERAAAGGHAIARRNLSQMDAQAARAGKPAKSSRPSEGDPEAHHPGEEPYVSHCAMCHGLNGLSLFPGAPSFALGQRLDRGIPALLFTVMDGHLKDDQLMMPGFDTTLSLKQMTDLITYLRMLKRRFEEGVASMRSTVPIPQGAAATSDSREPSAAAEGASRDRRKN